MPAKVILVTERAFIVLHKVVLLRQRPCIYRGDHYGFQGVRFRDWPETLGEESASAELHEGAGGGQS